MTTQTKKQVSAQDYEKQIEIESAYLQHYSHLSKIQADKSAQENVSEIFEIV